MKGGQQVFALDIGTRTIAGLIVQKENNIYKILAHEILEHESRVMYDGRSMTLKQLQKA